MREGSIPHQTDGWTLAVVQCNHIQVGNKSQRGDLPPASTQIKRRTDTRVNQLSGRFKEKKKIMSIVEIERHMYPQQYYTFQTLEHSLSVIWQVIITIITPEQPPSISGNESHSWFVTVTSATVIYQRDREREGERWKTCRYDAVMSIWILLVPADPSPTFINSHPFSSAWPWAHTTR